MRLGCGRIAAVAAAGIVAAAALPAQADPCEAIQQSGPLPAWVKPGAAFAGRVRYVIDGDGLCVGSSADPRQWVEVRLADFYAPELNETGGREAKATLQRLAAGREVQCAVTRQGRVRSYDRVVAVCRIRGRSLSELIRATGVVQGGRGWNP
ncbi:MAG: nuclease [Alphaproteobacteria bacterium]|nr:MAG: nuclease [Alphaproteobacteria bacterium]